MSVRAAVLIVAVVAGSAWGIPPGVLPSGVEADPDRAWFERCVADLDVDDLSRRDAAVESLRDDPRSTLELVERCLSEKRVGGEPGTSSQRLSPEQRERLRQLGYARFLSTPRAAMGISFARVDGMGGGVEISGAVNGFDSQRVMEPGDVIRALNGEPIVVDDDARAAILSHDPGDEVTVELLRRGEVRIVKLRLGRFDDLQRGASMPGDGVLARAWEVRCARRSGGMVERAPVIESGLTVERWNELMLGGEPKTLPPPRQAMQPLRGGGAMLAMADEAEGPVGLRAGGADAGVPLFAEQEFSLRLSELAKNDQQIDQHLRSLAEWRARIHNNEARLRQGGLTPFQRRQIENESVSLRQMIANARQKLRMLEEQAKLKGL